MTDTLINSLNQRISELTQKNANLNSALKQARGESTGLKTERDGLKTQVGTLTAERDTFKTRAEAAPGDQQKRIADLEGQLSARDHRDSFRDAAASAGVRPEAVADLYSLSGLKPGDQPAQPEDFAEFLGTAKQARAWAFGAAPDAGGSAGGTGTPAGATQGALTLTATSPPAGSGRGAPDPTSGRFSFRASDLGDAAWMKANQGKLAEAVQAGTAHQLPG